MRTIIGEPEDDEPNEKTLATYEPGRGPSPLGFEKDIERHLSNIGNEVDFLQWLGQTEDLISRPRPIADSFPVGRPSRDPIPGYVYAGSGFLAFLFGRWLARKLGEK